MRKKNTEYEEAVFHGYVLRRIKEAIYHYVANDFSGTLVDIINDIMTQGQRYYGQYYPKEMRETLKERFDKCELLKKDIVIISPKSHSDRHIELAEQQNRKAMNELKTPYFRDIKTKGQINKEFYNNIHAHIMTYHTHGEDRVITSF